MRYKLNRYKMKYLILFCLVHILFISGLNAQWQPDVRLTSDPYASVTSINNAWCISASGDFIHVVWWDLRNGNREIYYERSTNGGVSWGGDIRLTNNSAESSNPSIYASGSFVHVIWQDERDGNFEIYYKRSTNNGVSWGSDTRLTNSPNRSVNPSLSVYTHYLHLVWADFRNNNYEIYYKRSTNGGLNWLSDTRLTNDPANSGFPSVSVSGLDVHVVWEDNRDGDYDIYFLQSTDGGVIWRPAIQLSNNTVNSVNPSVSSPGNFPSGDVHVVYSDESYSNYEIHYRYSSNGGLNWLPDRRLTVDNAWSSNPCLAVYNSFVHMVWVDNRNGNDEIYYKRSTNTGVNWSADVRLTNNSSGSTEPSISVSNSEPELSVHVVWSDLRDGNSEIYYKRNPTGNPIGIKVISSEIPKEFNLFQNYPNPFNPSTNIRFDVQKQSIIKIFVYDVVGRLVETMVNEELKPGSYKVDFNGTKYSSGIYFYCLKVGDFVEVRKMILLK